VWPGGWGQDVGDTSHDHPTMHPTMHVGVGCAGDNHWQQLQVMNLQSVKSIGDRVHKETVLWTLGMTTGYGEGRLCVSCH
jgi:hypothetical protein